jgi:hypothetical protein
MNKAEAVYVAGLIADCREQGIESSYLPPLERLIERRQQPAEPKRPNTYQKPKGGLRAKGRNEIPQASRLAVQRRSSGCCEVETPDCPVGWHNAHHMHHISGRTGVEAHAPSNLLYVCNAAHAYIHAHPEVSRERGWMVSRLGQVRP